MVSGAQGDVAVPRVAAGGDDRRRDSLAVARASRLLRFIRAPEWITTRPAPIQSAAWQAAVI